MSTEPGRFNLTFADEPTLELTDLHGIGRKTTVRLEERGIFTPADLLLFIPRKYRPMHRHMSGPEMAKHRAGYAEFFGRITRVNTPPKHSRAPVEVHVDVDGQPFKLIWFNMNRPSFTRIFKVDKWLLIDGDVDWERNCPTLAHPTFDVVGRQRPSRRPPEVRLQPVYPSMERINDSAIRKAIVESADRLLAQAVDIVPADLRDRHDLPTVRTALETIHLLVEFGDVEQFRAQLQRARHRLVYEEFYTLQRKLTEDYITERRSADAPGCRDRQLGRDFVRRLPFSLTSDQNAAIGTIADDLERPTPMRRLLQGDVGSGKTVVAFMAAAIAIGSGKQVAMMAPTDILAKQHLRRARQMFDGLPVNVGLLTGSQTAGHQREVLEQLRAPQHRDVAAEQSLFDGGGHDCIDLIIGTHALFGDEVALEQLGLIIVDEQHKFGVEQRQRLLDKGCDPHLLAMTATPIPRSLAHAVFGDLDLTIIGEKPPGRKPIRTFLRDRSRAQRVYDYVRERIENTGEQAYFVYPMVEASSAAAGRRNVTDSAHALANGPLSSLTLGILHGRMDTSAKDHTMHRFANGDIQVLCATTVVEVGMDVANATMMVIESPEVFGLSQLHQLRGRVGRGSADSMCILLAGSGLTDDAQQRLTSFSGTEDGFELAETDLEIRGPGEFLGVRQAGLPEFRFGDILRDSTLIEWARRDARRKILGDASR